eukprot:scaffold115_cov304-Prasinococcus_capsulatus_cf.AAC.26
MSATTKSAPGGVVGRPSWRSAALAVPPCQRSGGATRPWLLAQDCGSRASPGLTSSTVGGRHRNCHGGAGINNASPSKSVMRGRI